MFAKHAKDHKNKGDYLGFLGGEGVLKGEEKAVKEEMKEEANVKDEEDLRNKGKNDISFVQEAWSLLNGLTLEEFVKKSAEEISKEEIYFLEDYYSYNFRAQNLN